MVCNVWSDICLVNKQINGWMNGWMEEKKEKFVNTYVSTMISLKNFKWLKFFKQNEVHIVKCLDKLKKDNTLFST